MDVFNAIRWFINAARLTTAGALISRISGDGDVALFGQTLGIQPGDLLFHTAIRMRDHHRRVGLLGIVVDRGVNVGGDVQTVELVADRMNVDLARFVPGDRAVVRQGERVLFVVRRQGFASREADQCRHEGGFEDGVFHVKLLSNQKGGSSKGRQCEREASQSSCFSLRNCDTRSAICTLFKSDIGKWVLPLMPISGKWISRTSPPCLLTASRHSRAIFRRARQLS